MIASASRGRLPSMARLSDLPVFPLPLVLLPGELLPLHIFEPRYRELVARCLAGPEPFCVVLEDDAGVREVGCLARDLTVLERLADGRLNIVVSGGEPVRLGPIDEEAHSYLSAEALVLEDDEEPLAEDEMEAALAAYRALLSEIGREDPSRSRRSRASPTRSARASTSASRSARRCSSRARSRAPRAHHRGPRAGAPQPAHRGRARAPRGAQRQGRADRVGHPLNLPERSLVGAARRRLGFRRAHLRSPTRSAGPSSPEADDRRPGVEPERLEG